MKENAKPPMVVEAKENKLDACGPDLNACVCSIGRSSACSIFPDSLEV